MASSAYPTRVQYVGEMSCLFINCYKRGTFPICSIGPSWPFTIILVVFAILCGCYMGFMLTILYSTNTQNSLMACGFNGLMVFINIAMLILGICADPGVPPSIYRRYTKAKYGKQYKQQQRSEGESKYAELDQNIELQEQSIDEIESTENKDNVVPLELSEQTPGTEGTIKLDQDDQEELQDQKQDQQNAQAPSGNFKEFFDGENDQDDLESLGAKSNMRQRKGPLPVKQDDSDSDPEDDEIDTNKPSNYPQDYQPKYRSVDGKRVLFCDKCNVEVRENMEHCEDCQVCVDGIDHHCVFFSKCIAKNNLCYFWSSLALLLANFFLMALSVIWFSHQATSGRHSKHRMDSSDPIGVSEVLQNGTDVLDQGLADVMQTLPGVNGI